MSIESTGSGFNLEKFLRARDLTIKATKDIASKIEVGMNEADGKNFIDNYLKEMGSQRLWHPTKFRVGSESKKIFREKPDQNIKLQEDDIFFIDIGPVFDGHEADYGETFATGTKFSNLAIDSKKIFDEVSLIWKKEKLTGIELYQRAQKLVESKGYAFAPQTGHRIGDFPHALHYKGNLGNVDFHPSPNLWILEIHILKDDHGAFFEDILMN